jgi:hypothetical protein
MRTLRVVALLALLAFGVGLLDHGASNPGSHAPSRAQAHRTQADRPGCDPNYAGACLDPYASDYDCAGGSGNGPDYTGTVTVVGVDHYGLDADGDRIGCEAG